MSLRRFQLIMFSCTVSAGIFYYLFTRVSLDEVLSAVRGLDPQWFGFFLFFSILTSIFRTWRYHLLLATSGYRVKRIPLFLVTLVRNFFADLLPARLGTLIYVYLIRTRLHVPLAPALASFAYAFVFDILALAVLLVPAVVFLGGMEQSNNALLLAGVVLAGSCALIIAFLPGLAGWSVNGVDRFPLLPLRWRGWLTNELFSLQDNLLKVRDNGLYWQVLALSLCVRLGKYLGLYVLLLGLVLPFGYAVADFPIPKVFLGLCSAELAASLPISGIAGFGAYEGAWALVFQLLGYSEQLAVLTSISHHLITQVYGYSLGGIALLILLLPFGIKEEGLTTVQLKPFIGNSSKLFWLKFAGSIAVALLLCFLLVPGGTRTERAATAGPIPFKTATSSFSIAGKVVYQRADGIYMTEVNGGRTDKLVAEGSYPRWSPDGRQVAFIRGNDILLYGLNDKRTRKLTTASQARALCFRADGAAVLFTDGKSVREVEITTGKTRELITGSRFLELDIHADGNLLVVTEKTLTGYRVSIHDLRSGKGLTVARGCSASFSPDGRVVTVNSGDHTFLKLYQVKNLKESSRVPAPAGKRFDNQFWSNHRDWLVSTVEGERTGIYIHHLPTGRFQRVTELGDSDRADLFVIR